MPYPRSFLRLVMSGTLPGGEIFSTGLNLAEGFGQEVEQPEDLEGYADACAAWFARTDSRIGSSAALTLLKVNKVGTDGRYTNDGATYLWEYPSPFPAGAQSVQVPNQVTTAVTLTTSAVRGRASRGRMFPPLACGPIAQGLQSEAVAVGMANSMVTFLNDLQAVEPGVSAHVMSSVGEGAARRVTGAEVGRVPDTIRARRNALDDQRYPGTLAVDP